jgi:hypothetical protein
MTPMLVPCTCACDHLQSARCRLDRGQFGVNSSSLGPSGKPGGPFFMREPRSALHSGRGGRLDLRAEPAAIENEGARSAYNAMAKQRLDSALRYCEDAIDALMKLARARTV